MISNPILKIFLNKPEIFFFNKTDDSSLFRTIQFSISTVFLHTTVILNAFFFVCLKTVRYKTVAL